MKTNILKLTALGLLFLLTSNLSQAGEPNKRPTSATTTICAIPGWYQEIDRHTGGPMTVTCSLTTNNTCVYVPGPCNATTGGGAVGTDAPAPVGLNVAEGQNFYARYDDGVLQVNLITSYTTDIQTQADGTSIFILNIQP
jgi:hypothetical protein